MSVFVPEKQAQARAFSLLLVGHVREYFKDEKHRAEFEAWYLERFGKPYEWQPLQSAHK